MDGRNARRIPAPRSPLVLSPTRLARSDNASGRPGQYAARRLSVSSRQGRPNQGGSPCKEHIMRIADWLTTNGDTLQVTLFFVLLAGLMAAERWLPRRRE